MNAPRHPTASPQPLDHLLSNSSDPVKSSIRRNSAMGWSKSPSPTNNTGTTPLRIAKRDSSKHALPLVARRSSSSYKHLRNNNLVSKSPFKSQIPSPSKPSTSSPNGIAFPRSTPRKVSGEKRPRPDSMHDQAENERPFALKRERHQSNAYQGLIEKEPVTKSPFKRAPAAEEETPPVPPKPIPVLPISEPSSTRTSNPPRAITPTRPSLVTKRLHGPRAADQPSLERRRQRRKTVTWDERCDVLEFDCEEAENESFYSDEDDYGTPEQPEQSAMIVGSLPSELEPGNRLRRRASVSSAATIPFHPPDQDNEGTPSTPPHTSTPNTSPPLPRSTHAERIIEDHRPTDIDEDVNMMPPSPSPAKKATSAESSNRDSLIPKFQLPLPHDQSSPKSAVTNVPTVDPFSIPPIKDEPQSVELSFSSLDEQDPMDPANLSIGHSEVSLSNVDLEAEIAALEGRHLPYCEDYQDISTLEDILPRSLTSSRSTPPPTPDLSFAGVSSGSSAVDHDIDLGPLRRSSGSPTGLNLRRRSDSPLNMMSRIGSIAIRPESPILRKGSPLREYANSPSISTDGSVERAPRTRISREGIQSRLMRKRSVDSPLASGGKAEQDADARPPQQTDFHQEDDQQTEPAETSMVDSIFSYAETEEDKERDKRMSTITDISAELATIQTAEKFTLNSAVVAVSPNHDVARPISPVEHGLSLDTNHNDARPRSPNDYDFLPPPHMSIGLSADASFASSLGLGAGHRGSMSSAQLGDMRSALDRLMDDVKGTASASASTSSSPNKPTHMRIESVTEGIKPGQFDNSFGAGDESMRTETDFDASMSMSMSMSIDNHVVRPRAAPLQRAATDSVVYSVPEFGSSVQAEEHPESQKHANAIREREELILEKRRAARRRDDDESMGYYTPPRATPAGRPSRRRSRSTGDAGALAKGDRLLNIGFSDDEGDHLADSISKELKKLDPENRKEKYRIREHEAIFASADSEQVSHMSLAGDVNGGKAWRAVRRPSDMNEYSKQIKEYRSMEKPGKAHGKVFVRVLGVRGLKVPIPQQATALTCTLNNGIHFVTTPETRLSTDMRIDQEFELIEHNKLEFTLTLKVRRDPHITAQAQALVPPPPTLPTQPTTPAPPKSRGGMLGFFSSSPKKQSRATPPPPPPPVRPHKLPDNLARYLKQDGTLARALISFKDVAMRCDTRLFETSYPLIGQRFEASGSPTTMELGEIVLQMFRLPPLPGVVSNQLPQSLEECHRGLRHVAWHKVTYFEGTLTQNGGDCATWRRRRLRVIGANLVAFSDVTKKATATINLKKAIAIEDNQDSRAGALSPGPRSIDDYDGLCTVERSFRLVFPGDQEIFFFADTDDEKAKWLEVFRALVGHIPPNPLWAELIWQRQQEMAKQPPSQMSPSSSGPLKGR